MLNVELLRRMRRLSQAQLAAKARTTQTNVSLVEAGALVPDEDLLERLADALLFSPPDRLLREVRVNQDDYPEPGEPGARP